MREALSSATMRGFLFCFYTFLTTERKVGNVINGQFLRYNKVCNGLTESDR